MTDERFAGLFADDVDGLEDGRLVDDVHHPRPQARQPFAQDLRGRHRLEGRDVTDAPEHHLERSGAIVVAGPWPRAAARRTVGDRVLDAEVLQMGLLVDDDQVTRPLDRRQRSATAGRQFASGGR